MLADILDDPRFSIVFSVILGFGIASLFRPLCSSQGGATECREYRAPDVKEMNDHVYRIGKKCYQFKSSTVDCPVGSKVIEAFW
jgi:hypothetical protein